MKQLKGFADRLTDERTIVNVESLLQLKIHHAEGKF